MKKILLLLSIMTMSLFSVAKADDKTITNNIEKMGLTVREIKDSPVNGLKLVIADEGLFYVSNDGRHLLQTSLYDISGGYPRNVTNQVLVAKMEELKDEMIIFKAADEKYVVTVFTDITCGYCVKMQNEVEEYNKKGITIRYLAFPRAGVDDKSAKTMKSIWCMADRKGAFTQVSKDNLIAAADCKIDLNKHYQLGVMFGIQGTPAIVIDDIVLPGYQDAGMLYDTLTRYYSLKK